jgi:hypothetical protein
MSRRLKRALAGVLVVLLAFYIGSYVVLSRRGFAEADAYAMKGFYFFPPENTDLWRQLNYGCVALYYPLIFIDEELGTGRSPAREPMWGLSR